MTSALLLAIATVGTSWAGTKSLRAGLAALLGVGYCYGILRANFADTYSYLLFDGAVIGLYAAQLWRPLNAEDRRRLYDLRVWLILLVGWPTLLFLLYRTDDPLIELVGLRSNIFLLPFLLLGARLRGSDIRYLATTAAVLCLVAVGLGGIEYFVGIEPFFPKNEITEIIYKSRDLVGWTAFRIPSSFSSSHAFAGTLVVTMPLLLGGWVQPDIERWESYLFPTALGASLLGVFMAAARQHMITAGALVLVITFAGQLRRRQWLRWVFAVAVVAYLVAGDARLQRFSTLRDTEMITDRLSGSINGDFFQLMGEYPMGNGLAGGGTSIPYFLQERARPAVGLENEYSRIMLEQGIPGLFIWGMFIVWIVLRPPTRPRTTWQPARTLAWVTTCAAFVSAFIGTGMLTSVPQSMLFLLSAGWIAVRPPTEDLAETHVISWPVRWTSARAAAAVPAPEL
jgi:hypothetical protein